jgi:hypothetical protein
MVLIRANTRGQNLLPIWLCCLWLIMMARLAHGWSMGNHKWKKNQQQWILIQADSVGIHPPTRPQSNEIQTLFSEIDHVPTASTSSRRQLLLDLSSSCCLAVTVVPWDALAATTMIAASDDDDDDDGLYVRKTDRFAYEFRPPPSRFDGPTQKPLKTHVDEVNFVAVVGGYQFGITVDPVRIDRLEDFGTPEQVAAKVVLAEVNRDGVFEVTLMEDPITGKTTMTTTESNDTAAAETTFYQLNYLSTGKRGTKRFVAKFFIENQYLYALTAQCKEEMYNTLKDEILQAVQSFRVIS